MSIHSQSLRPHPDAQGFIAIICLSTFSKAGAYLLFFNLLQKIGVSNIALVTLIVPIFAILLGAIILKEKLHFEGYTGTLLLAFGLLIINKNWFIKMLTKLTY